MQAISEMRYPSRGIDLTQEVSGQPPLTTPIGKNVRVFEPMTRRGRGGSRPGTLPIPPGQVPAGAHLIQMLNTVVTTDADYLPITVPIPPNPVFPNPSSPGLPAYWGFYPTGVPRTTRSPQDSFPPGGTGFTPTKSSAQTHHLTIYGPSAVKNFSDTQVWVPGEPFFTGFLAPFDTLTATYSSPGDAAMSPVGTYPVNVVPSLTNNTGEKYVIDAIIKGTLVVQPDPPPTPKHCWQGQLTVRITKPPPDPFGWTGQVVDVVGVACTSAQPGTSETARTVTASEGLPAGTLLMDQIARFLLNHVGSDSFGTVTSDLVSLSGSASVCSADDGTCSGALPPTQNASPGAVGAVIGAG
jgi:hypothetical protein